MGCTAPLAHNLGRYMTPKQVNALEAIHDQTWYAIRAAEDWADEYRKDPKTFEALVKAENRLMRNLKGYFDDLPARAVNWVDWPSYRDRVVKAYDVSVQISQAEFEQEQQVLMRVLFNDVVIMTALGSQAAGAIYRIIGGLTPTDLLIQKAATNLTSQLAEVLTKHTAEQVSQSIQTSLKLGESIDDATARLEKVVGDAARAEKIARTESVRSYSTGVITYGLQTGAISKTWMTVGDPCPLCQSILELNEDGTVGIDDSFASIGGDYWSNPAHVRCRCGVRLNYPVDRPVDENGNPLAPATSQADLAVMLDNMDFFG